MRMDEYKNMIQDYVFKTNKERNELHSDLQKDAVFTKAMQLAYIAIDALPELEEIAKDLIGTRMGIKLDKILAKFHDFDWQEAKWREFYMTYNDDNARHCENAFFNQHFETAEEIEESNFRWIGEILNRCPIQEVIEITPDARFFMKEEMFLNLEVK